ncbi:transcriptional regulatory protein RcsB [Achromobacter xylosoxidans]|nr:transcriptional regulatory protein RcsB [Achromobacter xylosoxidans]
METLNVIIADDHPIVLFGLRELIKGDARFRVIGEAMSSSALVKLLQEQPVHVVITDYNMPDDSSYGDGLKLIDYLIRNFPQIQVLVLTMISTPTVHARLLDMGVVGVIQKRHMHTEIERALGAIFLRRQYRGSQWGAQSGGESALDEDHRFASLSFKEREILRLFVTGKTVGEIARSLNRSPKTISTQKMSAMRKLELNSDQELMTYCMANRYFS